MMTWDEYAAGWRDLHGGYDPRTGSPFVRGWLRLAYRLGRAAARVGAAPSVVTGAGLALSVGVPVVAWLVPGGPFLAAALALLSTVADSIDGAVALLTDRASRFGQVLDALADRVSEACWLVALWLLGAPGWLVLLCGGCCWLHEYLRARAAVAGLPDIGTVTVAERPTRIILVVASLVLAGAAGIAAPELRAGTVTAVAGIWAALAVVGFAQLMVAVRSALR